jgi:hypothetical protein
MQVSYVIRVRPWYPGCTIGIEFVSKTKASLNRTVLARYDDRSVGHKNVSTDAGVRRARRKEGDICEQRSRTLPSFLVRAPLSLIVKTEFWSVVQFDFKATRTRHQRMFMIPNHGRARASQHSGVR